ncbi:MAG: TspO and MBR like protein [Candidatus Jorgensenbacteria bacterium GW2011_GWA1_48_11]|uniref:TspO and MBR like protein n=1 Tax=Candidatus Jorgensenbacteria bacterium GW2011_GWA1_48_11 TaxID=1618660 RepID=A0A0G1WN37_9BACT|nr:MAG: TspO and MBR like protein [Candidatus Jorgensenbacteria bacterium GW2011_GWA1_48_11]KKW12254.1 MAG: TspO and MBR like protein [Candidatus Jorgensenbacteria bacterium GW2011_GWB1_49_9]
MQTYAQFYEAIKKPFFAPPGWVFGTAWGIIYPLITIAFIYTCVLVIRKRVPTNLLWVLIANLIANFLFTPIQLGFAALWPASLVILFIFGTLAFFEYKIWRHSKVVFFLLLPYLLWGAFATILQITITFIN